MHFHSSVYMLIPGCSMSVTDTKVSPTQYCVSPMTVALPKFEHDCSGNNIICAGMAK